MSAIYWRTADHQIAHRLESVGDLRLLAGSVLVIVGAADQVDARLPAYDDRVWVRLRAMTETVKELHDDGVVLATLPREELLVADLPMIAPAEVVGRLAPGADDVDGLLRAVIASGLPIEPLPADRPQR